MSYLYDMILPRYFFSKHENYSVIIGSGKPFAVGRVWNFKNSDLLQEWTFNKMPDSYIQVPGFNIIIQYAGSLSKEQDLNIKPILQSMAEYFLNNRIPENYGYFKRYEQK